MSDTQTTTNITQVGTVIVPVSDQDSAISFYCDKLGLEKRSDVPFGNGDRWVEVTAVGTQTLRLSVSYGKPAAPAPSLFLRPGTVLDAPWTGDARRFVELTARPDCAAVFRRGAPMQSGLRDALSLLATALGARPRPEQGLLIAKEFYSALGGHSETTADAETDLIRRIGKRRIVRLPSIAYSAT